MPLHSSMKHRSIKWSMQAIVSTIFGRQSQGSRPSRTHSITRFSCSVNNEAQVCITVTTHATAPYMPSYRDAIGFASHQFAKPARSTCSDDTADRSGPTFGEPVLSLWISAL